MDNRKDIVDILLVENIILGLKCKYIMINCDNKCNCTHLY